MLHTLSSQKWILNHFRTAHIYQKISLWDDRSRQREDIIPWFRWQWKATIKLNGLNRDTCLLCYTLLRRNSLKVVFFQKMRFGAHSSDPLVSQLQGSGMCHILNGSYVSKLSNATRINKLPLRVGENELSKWIFLWFWQSDENQHSNVKKSQIQIFFYFFFLDFWSLHWVGNLP